ncbi:MAG TPA: Nramp family divalent metal transporter [Thermomicrobiaceae bacterium]|nr:Nramp family divalent metal transporter [Thermomicrobiaceae bacterium]
MGDPNMSSNLSDDVEPRAPGQAANPRSNTAGANGTQPPAKESLGQRLIGVIGPGIITGVADDDPATIGTCTQVGASIGNAGLWTMLLTAPLMAGVQLSCAKIGLVAEHGLASVVKQHYSRWLLILVVASIAVANTINAGADLGGVAAAVNLLAPAVQIKVAIVSIAISIVALQFWGNYQLIERVFKWLTFTLFAYIVAGLLSKPDAISVLRGTFIPTFRSSGEFISALVAIAGTVFSPYLFFWQASQEAEATGAEQQQRREAADDSGDHKAIKNEVTASRLKTARWDVSIGMVLSNIVTYFMILAAAATLFKAGQHNVQTATEAAKALGPLAGQAASYVLAIGLIGTGFLAVPVLTGSAGYTIAEAVGWRSSLNAKPRHAKQFYAAIGVSTVVGLLMNFIGINPIRALFLTSILYGFLAPILLVVVLLIANNRQVMGDQVNGRVTNLLGLLSILVTLAAAVGLILTSI